MTKLEFVFELLTFREPGLGRSIKNLVNQAFKELPTKEPRRIWVRDLQLDPNFQFYQVDVSTKAHPDFLEFREVTASEAADSIDPEASSTPTPRPTSP